MTSFRFNFSGEDDNSESNADINESIQWLESEEITPDKRGDDLDDNVTRAKMFACGEVEIGHVISNHAIASIDENNGFKNAVRLAEQEHSDLLAGTYEGGLKIWECTYDLVEHLESEPKINLGTKTVLDLGCGAGILGIYALLKGAHVTFQDYNREVLEHATIPNVLLNFEEDNRTENVLTKCKFFSGDWASYNELPNTDSFDIILTSETIYNVSNYHKLINLFTKRLNIDGFAFVAAKTCYFGVGGGIRQFEQAIQKNRQLKSEVCWKSSGGIQREILKITHSNQ